MKVWNSCILCPLAAVKKIPCDLPWKLAHVVFLWWSYCDILSPMSTLRPCYLANTETHATKATALANAKWQTWRNAWWAATSKGCCDDVSLSHPPLANPTQGIDQQTKACVLIVLLTSLASACFTSYPSPHNHWNRVGACCFAHACLLRKEVWMLGQVRFWSPLSRNLPAIGPFDQKPQQKHDKSKTHYTIAMVEAANSETPDTSDFSLFSLLKAQAESNFEIASPEPACMPWRSRLNWGSQNQTSTRVGCLQIRHGLDTAKAYQKYHQSFPSKI